MPTKQAIGEYSLKGTTIGFAPGPAGSVVVQANFEGTATGFGAVMCTMTASPAGQPNGTWESCGATYPDDGNSLTAAGRGTFSKSGLNRWRTNGHIQMSDGSKAQVEGELDLATRIWSGTLFTVG